MKKRKPQKKSSAKKTEAQPAFGKAQLLRFHELLLRPRLIEEHMLLLLRQGRLSKWFSGIGQEAIAVGATAALSKDEWILPLHRNLGVFTTREVPLERLFLQWQGKDGGFTKGRDRSFHFGTKEFHIVGMITHLGAQLPVGAGLALAHRAREEKKVVLAFTGEGGTSEGDFHEALNIAAVWNLPIIFLIENNGYALSTPTQQQFRADGLYRHAAAYGMSGVQVDGNNILEVYSAVSAAASRARDKSQPTLIECLTFRMRGHEEASGQKYVPKELLEKWAKKDPLFQFENYLTKNRFAKASELELTRNKITAEVKEEVERAFAAPDISIADTTGELSDVFAPLSKPKPLTTTKAKKKMRFVDAISDALDLALREYPDLILMGQDIAEYGGVFKVTEGFLEKYGASRIRNTPLCESAVLGMGLGLSVAGIKSVIEMQFADFVSYGVTQICNNIAKSHYRWGQNVDLVIRMPTGAGTRAGPFHSQSNEAWFTHIPGLKVVYPSTCFDAKGLLLAAVADPNPVMFFEHKALYRSIAEEIPEDVYEVEIGKARVVREGEAVTIITYGMGVHWTLELLQEHPEIDAYVLDLRTLVPLDYEAIASAVKATGRVLVLHEDTLFGGLGGEIAAWIAEHCFTALDAPIIRTGSLDTPVPFASVLEDNFLAKARLKEDLLRLIRM